MMGFFDLPAPLFSVIDALLAEFLSATIRLIIWALFGGGLSMALYRWFSKQDRLAELKPKIKQAQRQLANFDGEFSELRSLIRENLRLSWQRLGLVAGPALLAALPLLFLLVWASNHFGYQTPTPGASVQITLQPASSRLHWQPESAVMNQAADNTWLIQWPNPTDQVNLLSEQGEVIATLPTEELTPILHQRQWWNWLVDNPGGHLPTDTQLEIMEIALPRQSFLELGPEWMRGWEFLFLSVALGCSLTIQWVWKVH
ncbi:MAG: hypothetical protein V2J55_12185 [Candidatus Competibacteraceae bacterium]|jgi:hypothetical protein|nr:hypothetical protein [Candidatus Competibacteraceae bacterium]